MEQSNAGTAEAQAYGSALEGLAWGRIALGVASLAAPRWLARRVGIRATPELTYMTRVFAARAVALGIGYLTADAAARVQWQRLALMVDVTDTAHGWLHVLRGDLARSAALPFTALTTAYMATGLARFASDLDSREQ